jgi:hypothetical protein
MARPLTSYIWPKPKPLSLDSGHVVGPSTIVPRSERQYDIVVLGATGFTGYLAARHLAKTYGVNQSVKWAIAGRSATKLEQVKSALALELNQPEIATSLETIVVDTSIPATLPKLVSVTRVVASTAGPYSLYGNSVVEFCAKFGTHYVDITGEVLWVQAMLCQWQTTAQASGAILVPFCGHGTFLKPAQSFGLDTLVSAFLTFYPWMITTTVPRCRLDSLGSFRLGAAKPAGGTEGQHDQGFLLGRDARGASRWDLCHHVQ